MFYAGVDFLILLGVIRDLIVNRSIHQVYRYALPAIILGQVVVMYIATRSRVDANSTRDVGVSGAMPTRLARTFS